MKALQWQGVNKLAVGEVPDPEIRNAGDIIVKVRRTVTCGSDLHLLGGYIPFMEKGDVLGHEFIGEVVEAGPDVRNHRVGDRVVVSSFISCGKCWFCEQRLFSLCDNGNTNPAITETMWGQAPGGCFGYSHAMGGNPGSHAQYIRVPFADVGAFTVPDAVSDERALFASDSARTGWMGADLGGVQPGDVVAVWGAGAVGQMAARAAVAARRRPGDRHRPVRQPAAPGREVRRRGDPELRAHRRRAELRERSGGRGPGRLHRGGRHGGTHARVRSTSTTRSSSSCACRPTGPRRSATRSTPAARAARCSSSASTPASSTSSRSVPLMNKGLTVRGAQQHGQRYIPMLLDRMARGELVTEHLATHVMPLDRGADRLRMFKKKEDDCVRAVFLPN